MTAEPLETHTAVPAAFATSAPGQEWWRSAVIYQVYPRSFADSDGDGIGDLPGITARLPHLAELGVDALWLSPFYSSPQADAGYDVADYREVDPVFGDLAAADDLLARAHQLGLRVIVDIVPNHTSDEHAWFQAALAAGPGSAERARYLFRDGLGEHGELPPNSWRSVFGGPAWTRVTEPGGAPGQWYLHLFDVKQPDLDWTNPVVHAEFDSVLRFWLDRGVNGFRIDVAHGLVKAEGLPDWDHELDLLEGGDSRFSRPPFWDQPGVHEIYREWHRVVAEYAGDRVLVAEAWVYPAARISDYVRPDELHQSFNFPYLVTPWQGAPLREVITESLAAMAGVGAPATWVLSNHDVLRHTTRFGFEPGTALPNGIGADDAQPDAELGLRRGRAATMLMLALPGSAYLYQGEELGLPEHTSLPDDVRQDPTWLRSSHEHRGRDGCRVPLPWSADAPSYGFGPTSRTWLPQPASWAALALDAQRAVPGSTYETYREALALRRAERLGEGELTWVEGYPAEVVAFRTGEVLVLANTGTGTVPLPDGAQVLLTSVPVDLSQGLPADVTVWVRAR
ncbi:glycoside hydrolase family 13 protein [Angustibacter luteus]|uniref:Glycoside hydrolase family 13 protein n=1 Tax=Angustibacter luteus TaxID=658456 RepID=A0ABW1JKA9_9ACTN